MRRQQSQLMCQAVPSGIGLFLREFWAEHNIAKHRRASQLCIRAGGVEPRGELVDGKAHDIRRARQIHPVHMQFGNGVLVDAGDRGFRLWA